KILKFFFSFFNSQETKKISQKKLFNSTNSNLLPKRDAKVTTFTLHATKH
ncbi:MAG: hypothetical protein ACI85I_002860, partial [Arenicella sp.]